MNELFRNIISAFLPERCALCRQPVENFRDCPFCRDCLIRWEHEKFEASETALGGVPAVRFADDTEEGGQALYTAFYDPSEHDRASDALAYKLKRRTTRVLTGFVAEEYAGLLERGVPELFDGTIRQESVIVTWLPRRPESVLEYGYDHMERVAAELGRLCGFSCQKLLLRRKGSEEQKTLSADQRLENVGKSLEPVGVRLDGKTIILIDDLVTTGASLKVAENILRSSGARVVICAALLATRKKGST